MSPLDFKWTEDQQVTVLNPTSKSFTWKVHGKDYQLGAGKTAKMPGFIAWIYVYNQAVLAAQKDDVWSSWNDEGFREQYFDKFVVGIDELVQIVEDEPEPEITVFGETEANEPKEPQVSKHGKASRSQ